MGYNSWYGDSMNGRAPSLSSVQMSNCAAPRGREIANRIFPSGDHDAGTVSGGSDIAKRSAGPLPSAGIQYVWSRPERLEENMTRAPSGVHIGLVPPSTVSRFQAVVSKSRVQISPPRLTVARRPSGEIRGFE